MPLRAAPRKIVAAVSFPVATAPAVAVATTPPTVVATATTATTATTTLATFAAVSIHSGQYPVVSLRFTGLLKQYANAL